MYLHLDLDALDPDVGPGVVDPPVPGGLSARQLADLLGRICERFAVVGATIATYTAVEGRRLDAACGGCCDLSLDRL